MNWDAIGSIGEIVGAVAVLLTLVYLAKQIHQSNRIARLEFHKTSVQHYTQVMGKLVSDTDTARIYREGLLDLASLEPVDKIRLSQLIGECMLMFKDVMEAYDEGLFDKPTYDAWLGFICGIINMPSGETFWEEAKEGYIPRLQEVIDNARTDLPRADQIAPSFWAS